MNLEMEVGVWGVTQTLSIAVGKSNLNLGYVSIPMWLNHHSLPDGKDKAYGSMICKKWPQFFLSLYVNPLKCSPRAASIKRWNLYPHSLN